MSSFACQPAAYLHEIKIDNFRDAKKYDCLLQVPHPAILVAVNCVWGQLRRQIQLSDPFEIQMKQPSEILSHCTREADANFIIEIWPRTVLQS
jgi:hypothetical protein